MPASSRRPASSCWTRPAWVSGCDREGMAHQGIYLQWPGTRHHLDFVDLFGRGVWVYGQTEVTKDLGAARDADGQEPFYEVATPRCTTSRRTRRAVSSSPPTARPAARRRLVAGCDGFHGRAAGPVPDAARSAGARLPVRLARHPRRRRAVHRRADLRLAPERVRAAHHALAAVSRLYLQVEPDEGSRTGRTTGSGTSSPRASARRTAGRCRPAR